MTDRGSSSGRESVTHTPETQLTEWVEPGRKVSRQQSRTMNNNTEERMGFLITGHLRQAVSLSVFVSPTPAPGLAQTGEQNPEKSKLDKW